MKAICILSLFLVLSFASTLQAAPGLTVLSVKGKSQQEIDDISTLEGVRSTFSYGDEVIVRHDDVFKVNGPVVDKVFLTGPLSEPHVAIKRGLYSPLDKFKTRIRVLYEKGGVTIFQTLPSVLKRLLDERSGHFEIIPFDEGLKLHVPLKRALKKVLRQEPAPLAEQVSGERMMADVKVLEEFVTRYAYSDKYIESAKWCQEEFKKMGYEASLVEYADWSKKGWNVEANTADHGDVEWFYVIGAHLDSTSPRPRDEAPGADDNGTGSAGVMEIARIFQGTEMAKHVRFVLFGGEEVGLRGSTNFVKQLKAAGLLPKVRGAVIFDMLGWDANDPISALVETKSNCEDYIQPFLAAAKEEAVLATSISYHPFGSDHMPFFREKVPCFLFIEDEYGSNPHYHQVSDKSEAIDVALFEAIVRVTVRAMSRLLK
mgnify:CR=1 FL=1